jgi:hypothetical protein
MPQRSKLKKQKLTGQTIHLSECGKSGKIWTTVQHGYAIFEKMSDHEAMTNLTIIDTDILIDTSRNKSEVIDYLQNLQLSSNLALSAVTQMELIVGCTNKAYLRTVENPLTQFSIIKIDLRKLLKVL